MYNAPGLLSFKSHQCSRRPVISKSTASNGDVMISHWHPVPWGKSNLGTTHSLKQLKVITADEESCQVLMVKASRQQWNSSCFSFSFFHRLDCLQPQPQSWTKQPTWKKQHKLICMRIWQLTVKPSDFAPDTDVMAWQAFTTVSWATHVFVFCAN